ncbi:Protein lin-54 isoform 1 [Schistosoma japonicum]|nr:Protein lin-54 isoform 1 [Schistosoma japonicum]
MKYKRRCIQLTQTNQSLDNRVDPSVLNLPCEEFYEDSVSLKFLSSGFVEAACNLILTQLIEAKLKNFSLVDQEKVITEEFGRCLLQIMNLLSHTPFSEYNYNPAYTTILPFAQRNISLQSANQDQGPYEQSLNCDSRKDQTNQYLFAEYGLKNAEYCKNAIFDNHNEFDSTKHENSLPTIEKWYNFEKYEDSQILNNHQTHNSNKLVTRDLEHCDILSVLDHQPGLSEIHNRDINQNYSEVEYPVVHQPESYVSSTDNYFFSDTNSLSVSNNKPHSQTLNMSHTLHSNIQYSENTEKPKMINLTEATIGNISNTSECLTEIYSEDEETNAATNALLNVPIDFDHNTYILSSEINLSEVAETGEYAALYSNEISSNITNDENCIAKSFIENRCSPSAVYELDFIPELEFYNL